MGGIKQIVVSLIAPGKIFQCPFPTFYENGSPMIKYDVTKDYDSHAAPHWDEYVLFDSAQVLPIFILTIGPKSNSLVHHRKVEAQKILQEAPKVDEEKLSRSNCVVDFLKLPMTDDIYYLSLPTSHLSKFHLVALQQTHVSSFSFFK